jgi:hypothetical protein
LSELNQEKDKWQSNLIAKMNECSCGQVGPKGGECSSCDDNYDKVALPEKCLICQKPGIKWKPCNYGCYVASKLLPVSQIPLICSICGDEDYGNEGRQCGICHAGALVQSFKGRILFSARTSTFLFPDDMSMYCKDSMDNVTVIPSTSSQFLLKDRQILFGTNIQGMARCVELATMTDTKEVKGRWDNVAKTNNGQCISCGRSGSIGDFCTNYNCGPAAEIVFSQLAMCLVCQNVGIKDTSCGNGCLVPSMCVSSPVTPVKCDTCNKEYIDEPGSECGWCRTGTLCLSFKGQILFSNETMTFQFPDD